MHAGEGGEAPPLTSSKSNKSTSPSCVRMWTVGKCGKRAWELVCVGVRVTGGRQGRGCLAGETPFACLRTIIALVKLTSQEASMDVVQGFVLTAAAPCTGLCAERRKSLKPFGRGVYAKRVLRVRPMHLPRWLGPGVLAFVRHETSPAGVKLNGTKPFRSLGFNFVLSPVKVTGGAESSQRAWIER